jgi:hypothetical protein
MYLKHVSWYRLVTACLVLVWVRKLSVTLKIDAHIFRTVVLKMWSSFFNRSLCMVLMKTHISFWTRTTPSEFTSLCLVWHRKYATLCFSTLLDFIFLYFRRSSTSWWKFFFGRYKGLGSFWHLAVMIDGLATCELRKTGFMIWTTCDPVCFM